MMRKAFSLTAIPLALILSVGALAAPAKKTKAKPSAEHVAAIKKCTEDYQASLKEAKTKKGKDRKEADAAAKQARKQCVSNAPM
jgi:hypothetical protein